MYGNYGYMWYTWHLTTPWVKRPIELSRPTTADHESRDPLGLMRTTGPDGFHSEVTENNINAAASWLPLKEALKKELFKGTLNPEAPLKEA